MERVNRNKKQKFLGKKKNRSGHAGNISRYGGAESRIRIGVHSELNEFFYTFSERSGNWTDRRERVSI